jgi:hypothetical protein
MHRWTSLHELWSARRDDGQAVVFATVFRVDGSPHLGVRVTFRVVFGHTEGYKVMPRRQSLLLVAFADSSPPCPASTANVSKPTSFPAARRRRNTRDGSGSTCRGVQADQHLQRLQRGSRHLVCSTVSMLCRSVDVNFCTLECGATPLSFERGSATRLHSGCCCCEKDVLLRWFSRYVTDL